MHDFSTPTDPHTHSSQSESRPTVLIFKTDLLPATETFIIGQASQLKRYQPVYVGLSRISNGGLTLPDGQVEVLNSGGKLGRLKRKVYRATGYAPEFINRLRARKPALIHAHFASCGLHALPLCRALNIPMVVTGHGNDVTVDGRAVKTARRFGFRYQRYHRLFLPSVSYIAVSRFIKERMIERGFPAEKIVEHYIGIDVEKFKANSQAPREKVILFVGRFVPKKGCEYLIRAMSLVQVKYPDIKLVLIGDGPLLENTRQLANDLGVNADFLGLQPLDAVKSWMRRAWFFCSPSVTGPDGDSEGLPTVLMEAQASGLPIVSTRHGPIPEAVSHQNTGLLVDEYDFEGLANAMCKLLADDAMHAAMSQAARSHVLNQFDIRKQTLMLEEIYDTAIENYCKLG